MSNNSSLIIESSYTLQKANHIRTTLLLISLSESCEYKKNPTRINRTLSKDLISKYESIEIIIENPVEMGTSKRNQSKKNTHPMRRHNSHMGTPITPGVDEINYFVKNIKRTVCSERKLIKLESQAQAQTQAQGQNQNNHTTQYTCLSRTQLINDSYTSVNNAFALMKISCNFLRKLSSTFIDRSSYGINSYRKMINQSTNKFGYNLELKDKVINNKVKTPDRTKNNVKFTDIMFEKSSTHRESAKRFNATNNYSSNNNINNNNGNDCKNNDNTLRHSTKLMTPRKPNLVKTRLASSNNLKSTSNEEHKLLREVIQINKKESFKVNKQKTLLKIAENYNDIVEDKISMECLIF